MELHKLNQHPNSSSKMADNHQNPPPPPTQHHKKQVRRRLHTTRPYQERLLNMAEARREIVTALKYHRAAMKKAAGAAADHQRQPETLPEPRCQEGRIRARKIPKSSTMDRNRALHNNNNNNNNNLKNLCYGGFPNWSMNSQPVDIVLPEQTLGLNLTLKDFNNLDANLFSSGSVSGSGSGSGSCSSSVSIARDREALNSVSDGTGGGGGGMHVAVGEEEMAEMRSIGEKHEVEWSDKMNMVKSAWWLRFMKMGKLKEEEEEEEEFGFGDPLDQVLEFPDWINNGNDTCFFNNNSSSSSYDDDPAALPCMDIGEFEGMDGEWLA